MLFEPEPEEAKSKWMSLQSIQFCYLRHVFEVFLSNGYKTINNNGIICNNGILFVSTDWESPDYVAACKKEEV